MALVYDSDPPIPELPGLAGRRIQLARLESIVTGPVRQILGWWQGVAADHPPRRADFDITVHGCIAHHLFLIEPVASGYHLVLAGEEYTRLLNMKKGTRWLREADDPIAHDFTRYLDMVAKIGKPYRSLGRLDLVERNWVEFEALLCPLLGPDSAAGGFFLGVAAEVDET
jgi:hypothetical protein